MWVWKWSIKKQKLKRNQYICVCNVCCSLVRKYSTVILSPTVCVCAICVAVCVCDCKYNVCIYVVNESVFCPGLTTPQTQTAVCLVIFPSFPFSLSHANNHKSTVYIKYFVQLNSSIYFYTLNYLKLSILVLRNLSILYLYYILFTILL